MRIAFNQAVSCLTQFLFKKSHLIFDNTIRQEQFAFFNTKSLAVSSKSPIFAAIS